MADDDAENCFLANEAFSESGVKATFLCVGNGVELVDYLADHSRSEAKRLPDLILLGLNMPRKNGRQAPIEIKTEPSLQHIPIVILTTSADQNNVDLTLKAVAESFITKPATSDEWVEMMKSPAERWLR